MVECADLTLLAADAFAYERLRRDPRVVQPQAWLSDALCNMIEHLTSRFSVLLPWKWKTRSSSAFSP
jgi:hypothetical protein